MIFSKIQVIIRAFFNIEIYREISLSRLQVSSTPSPHLRDKKRWKHLVGVQGKDGEALS